MRKTNPSFKRVVFLTQEEPLFVPTLCQTLIERLPQRLVAVGFFAPASSWKQFNREYLARLRYYGAIDFVRIAVLYLWKRVTQRPIRRAFSEHNIPVVTLPSSNLRDI